METPFVLSPGLEKTFRCKTRNAVALRTIFLFGQRLGGRIHDERKFHRPGSTEYPSLRRAPSSNLSIRKLAASFLRATLAQVPKAVFPRRGTKPVGARLPLDAPGEYSADSGYDRSSGIRAVARELPAPPQCAKNQCLRRRRLLDRRKR